MSWQEAYNLPIPIRDWLLNRFRQQREEEITTQKSAMKKAEQEARTKGRKSRGR